MPEWTVQKVKWISDVSFNSDASYKGKHCIHCNQELWNDFDLSNKYLIARINSILDENGKIIATIGEDIILECKKLYLPDWMVTGEFFTKDSSNSSPCLVQSFPVKY